MTTDSSGRGDQAAVAPPAEGDRTTTETTRRLYENVETIAHLHARAEEQVGRHQKVVEKVARRLSQPWSIAAVGAAAVAWVVLNRIMAALNRAPLDPPPYFWLQGAVSLFALFTMLVVLTTQHRQGHKAERQAHLELQINLHAEQKLAKLVQLVEELRRDIPAVPNRVDSTAEAMSRSADPHQIASAIDKTLADGAGDK